MSAAVAAAPLEHIVMLENGEGGAISKHHRPALYDLYAAADARCVHPLRLCMFRVSESRLFKQDYREGRGL